MEALQALLNLYRFLQTSDPRHLDDRARLLLKDLLDSSMEKILMQTNLTINAAAAQSGVAKTTGSSQSMLQNSKPSLSHSNALKPSLSGIQTPNTDSIDSIYENDGEFLHRNLRRPLERQSNSEFSICPSKLQNRTKRCRVCQQGIMKPETTDNSCSNKGDNRVGYQSLTGIGQLNSTRLTTEPKGDQVSDVEQLFRWKTSRQIQGNQSNAERLEEARSTAALSKGVDDSIKRIESSILSSQLNSQNAIPTSCSTSGTASSDNHISNPVARSKQEAGYGFDTNQSVQKKLQVLNRNISLIDEDMESLASAATRFTNVKDMVARIESMNQTPNKISEPHHVSRLPRRDQIAKKSKNLMKTKPSMPLKQSVGSTTKGSQAQQRVFLGPTLLNYESDCKIRTTRRPRAPRNRGKMRLQQELNSSTSPTCGSWTTDSQRSSIFSSSSIEPSTTGESRDTTSSKNSSRSIESSSHGTPSYRLSDERNTEEESDRIISSASPYYSTDEDPPPRSLGQRRMYNRSISSRSDKRRGIGRLRRLKNKLGLIFHHHHHHHHHHHQYPDTSNDYGATSSKSMWKNLHKMVFNHKEDNKKSHMHVKKQSKSNQALVSKNKKNNEQMGQFHSLVEGLVRHVRHNSKKSKADHSKKKKGLLRMKKPRNSRAKVKRGFTSRKPAQIKALKR